MNQIDLEENKKTNKFVIWNIQAKARYILTKQKYLFNLF